MTRLDTHPDAALIRERINRGAAWLDTIRPQWRENVDLLHLDLSDSSKCVLGQVFDPGDDVDPWVGRRTGFDLGVARLNAQVHLDDERTTPAVEYGFDARMEEDYSFDALDAGWLDLLDPDGEVL